MCGIVGIVRFNGEQADLGVLERMSAMITHRGPDAEGSYCSGSVAFGSRRLAILDSSRTAGQPMFSPDGQIVLIFNGEIYNYVELRKELQTLGHDFRSSGDTEVLLHAYMRWGRECLHKLNGMWAFLIYDIRQRRMFGSRDRLGKKPLYYCIGCNGAVFASEIKALMASGCHAHGPNWEKISQLLFGSPRN